MNQISNQISFNENKREGHVNKFDITDAVHDVEDKINDLAKANASLGKHFARLFNLSMKR